MSRIQCLRIGAALYLGMAFMPAFSQQEGTLYFMNSLPQVTYLNPASVPRYKFSIGLPGSSVFALYGNNGFTYDDFAVKEGGVVKADMNKLYDAMADKNYISLAAQADLFRLSLKVNPRVYLTFSTTAKTYSSVMLPKEATGLFVNGTSAYVNSSASLAPRAAGMVYIETAGGASYVVNKNLTVGLRVKMLKGAADVSTKSAKLDLAIDDDYAITVRADGDIRTSGLKNLFDNDEDPDVDVLDYLDDHRNDYLNNNGLAFDAGVTYKVNGRLTVGMSLLDIGSIHWKNDPYGYMLDGSRANYTFRGFDLDRILDGDDDYIDAEIDSIESRFTATEGRVGSYSSPLPAKMYLSGSYELKRNLNAGMLLFAERYNKRLATGVTFSVNKDFGRRVSTSLSYTVTNRSFNNVGAGLSLNFAPLQFYLVGDNLLRAPLALATDGTFNSFVNSMQYFNLRAGLNFVFGWDKTEEKQPYPTRIR